MFLPGEVFFPDADTGTAVTGMIEIAQKAGIKVIVGNVGKPDGMWGRDTRRDDDLLKRSFPGLKRKKLSLLAATRASREHGGLTRGAKAQAPCACRLPGGAS